MKKAIIPTCLSLWLLLAGTAIPSAQPEKIPSPQDMWRNIQKTLPAFSYTVESDETLASYTDPDAKLRRIEVHFLSQISDGNKLSPRAVIYLPVDPEINKRPDRLGKAVIVAHPASDDSLEWNYVEPIVARTRYPALSLSLPTDPPGGSGEGFWLPHLRGKAAETGDPSWHDLIRLAIPYLQAMDVLEDVLKVKQVRAIIGGHSKWAYYAYTAAAMDPARIASVIFMGCERLYYREEYPEAVKPFHTQQYVSCPVFYIGASNEGGYEMFNINRIQERMQDEWTIAYIPNYRHASNSEKQFINWPMWVSHIFDHRPIVKISDLSFRETETGTVFRARIDSPNKIILAKAWYVFCDDVPFWRDLVWYPANMHRVEGNWFEAGINGILPDAWFVEVKDTAMGYQGYISSLPYDITHKPTKERTHLGPGGRNWRPKAKKQK